MAAYDDSFTKLMISLKVVAESASWPSGVLPEVIDIGSSPEEFWSRAMVQVYNLYRGCLDLGDATLRTLRENDRSPSDPAARFVQVVEERGFVEQVARLPELVPLTTVVWAMHCCDTRGLDMASKLLNWAVSSCVERKDIFDALIARMGEGLLASSFFSALKRTVELRGDMEENEDVVLETLESLLSTAYFLTNTST